MAEYALALKQALLCWENGNCEEHRVPCTSALKEFAEKLIFLQDRIKKLESGIIAHRDAKESPDDNDQKLWKILNVF